MCNMYLLEEIVEDSVKFGVSMSIVVWKSVAWLMLCLSCQVPCLVIFKANIIFRWTYSTLPQLHTSITFL